MIKYKIVDRKLINAIASSKIETEMLWREARKYNDFHIVASNFSKMIDLYREYSAIMSSYYNSSKYESLVYHYDYGCSVNTIEKAFNGIKDEILGLRENVLTNQQKHHQDIFEKTRKFELNSTNQAFLQKLSQVTGFDPKRGYIGYGIHP